jgi:YVTN family beta-propeller protein
MKSRILSKIVALVFIFTFIMGTALAVEVQNDQGTVFTADEKGGTISKINLATGQVETVNVSIFPHNVQISSDGEWLAAVGDVRNEDHHYHGVDNHQKASKPGLLLLFQADDLISGPVSEIEVGSHPAHVVMNQKVEQAFVTAAGDNALVVVDLAQGKVVHKIETGLYPHGLRISPDEKEIYIANVLDNSVSVISIPLLKETLRIPVGSAPVQVGFLPDGSEVYVSLRDENKVAVIDTRAAEVTAEIEVGRGPIQVYATPDGHYVYIANEGTPEEPDEIVSIIGTAERKVVDTVRTGRGAHGVVVSCEGGLAFVTNTLDNSLAVIDTDSRKVVKVFSVGQGPNGVTYGKKK